MIQLWVCTSKRVLVTGGVVSRSSLPKVVGMVYLDYMTPAIFSEEADAMKLQNPRVTCPTADVHQQEQNEGWLTIIFHIRVHNMGGGLT
jgi:hypothetical protein